MRIPSILPIKGSRFINGGSGLFFREGSSPLTYLWLAGNEGREKKMETTIMGYIGTTVRIHFFIPS